MKETKQTSEKMKDSSGWWRAATSTPVTEPHSAPWITNKSTIINKLWQTSRNLTQTWPDRQSNHQSSWSTNRNRSKRCNWKLSHSSSHNSNSSSNYGNKDKTNSNRNRCRSNNWRRSKAWAAFNQQWHQQQSQSNRKQPTAATTTTVYLVLGTLSISTLLRQIGAIACFYWLTWRCVLPALWFRVFRTVYLLNVSFQFGLTLSNKINSI